VADLVSQAPLAFAAGLISVLSPCVLPLMPAYLSLVSGVSVEEMEDGAGAGLRRRVLLSCSGFIAGFSIVFMAMGVGAVAIGHVVRSWQAELFGVAFGIAQIAGVAIVVFGLHMTGLVPIALLNRDTRPRLGGSGVGGSGSPGRGLGATVLIGAGFGLGWSPCIGPILSTVLTLAASRETVLQGTLLLGVYSAGLAVPFLLAGWSIEFFFRSFARLKQHFRALEIASGAILVAVGLLLVFNQFTRLNQTLRFLNDWIAALEGMLL
jgi:cytochrome c-type biogenesis protein